MEGLGRQWLMVSTILVCGTVVSGFLASLVVTAVSLWSISMFAQMDIFP